MNSPLGGFSGPPPIRSGKMVVVVTYEVILPADPECPPPDINPDNYRADADAIIALNPSFFNIKAELKEIK